jgi:glutamate-1-semialdehyde 2,1-aminomutase
MNSQKRTAELKLLSHTLIPSGAHTYSRADNQFPECAPSFVSKAKGALFWDENGKEYIDYSM